MKTKQQNVRRERTFPGAQKAQRPASDFHDFPSAQSASFVAQSSAAFSPSAAQQQIRRLPLLELKQVEYPPASATHFTASAHGANISVRALYVAQGVVKLSRPSAFSAAPTPSMAACAFTACACASLQRSVPDVLPLLNASHASVHVCEVAPKYHRERVGLVQ